MKKLLSMLLVLALAVGLLGCTDVGIIGGEDGGTLIITDDGSRYLDETEEPSPEDLPEDIVLEETPEETAPEETIAEDIPEETLAPETEAPETEPVIAEDGWYYSKEDVALYLYTFGHLPENFITKDEARELGWEGGSVEKYAPGCAIGGDKFGNREGILPKEKGRQYYECDIDTNGRNSRGAKRIVFSNDGLIYYTDDHYESFTLLYGEE